MASAAEDEVARIVDKLSHLPTNELAGMPPRLGACLYAKSREAYGRVTLLPD